MLLIVILTMYVKVIGAGSSKQESFYIYGYSIWFLVNLMKNLDIFNNVYCARPYVLARNICTL